MRGKLNHMIFNDESVGEKFEDSISNFDDVQNEHESYTNTILTKDYFYKLIGETLIKQGYMSKPSFEDNLQKIISTTFTNLPQLLEKNESTWEDKDINEWDDSDFVEYEKCQPDYIASLPGDLRSTDVNLLTERKEVIDQKLKEVREQIGDITSNINRLENEKRTEQGIIKQNQKNIDKVTPVIEKFNEKRTEELDEIQKFFNNVDTRWTQFQQHSVDVEQQHEGISFMIGSLGVNLNSPFNLDKDYLNLVADRILEYGEQIRPNDGSNYDTRVVEVTTGLADDIKWIADSFPSDSLNDLKERYDSARNVINMSNQDISESKGFIREIDEELTESNNQITKLERMTSDLEDNKVKTQSRLDYANSRTEKMGGDLIL